MERPAVLIVDDEPGVRRLIQLVLGQFAGRMLEAGTGAEGLALAASERPDLILLDRRLPDLNGLEVCRRLKADPVTAGATVLLLSGDSDDAARQQGAESGADGYLAKPFSPAALLVRVRDLLGPETGAAARP